MSALDDNLAVVESIYAAFARGDLEGIVARLSPNVRWCVPDMPHVPYHGCRFGHAGVREFFGLLAAQELVSFARGRTLADDQGACAVGTYT